MTLPPTTVRSIGWRRNSKLVTTPKFPVLPGGPHRDESTWLQIRPEAIRRGEIRGRGNAVEVTASLLARPRVVLGHRPVPGLTPLPPLDTGRLEGDLRILAQGTARYDATLYIEGGGS